MLYFLVWAERSASNRMPACLERLLEARVVPAGPRLQTALAGASRGALADVPVELLGYQCKASARCRWSALWGSHCHFAGMETRIAAPLPG